MKLHFRTTFLLIILSFGLVFSQQKTYCNPINIDYGYTPIPNFATHGKHRATADPVIVNFKGDYYLFSTNQWGYWWSNDMLNWHFIERKFLIPERHSHLYDELCAPAVFEMKGELYVIGSTHGNTFPIWKSKNPKQNQWEIAVDSLQVGAWDPAFFYEKEQDKLYLYWGSSNAFPILGTEINTKSLQSTGFTKPIIKLEPEIHGWERFGEYNDNVFLQPFMEGAWVTKYKNKYYLQYGSPGTEFSGYADGVYVSENPLEGFAYQKHNPFSYKPGGFARGAGHGATFQDNYSNFWHVSTIFISTKNNFERRIGFWPAGFDKDDIMYCNTAYGDYPTFLPKYAKDKDFTQGISVGWMLLNYQKPVQVSSTLGGFQANFGVDEDIKTYWSAQTANTGEYYQSDLGEIATINAIQVNFADQDATFFGKQKNIFHQYKIWISNDGKEWNVLIDKSQNKTDVPHDYIELEKPAEARFVKIENIHMPTGKFALSGFRIFGKGKGEKPHKVENFIPLRASKVKYGNRMAAWLKWKQNSEADGYVIYFGKDKEKLYGSIMVYGKNEYYFTGMDSVDGYYFQIEAFNANGISDRSTVEFVE